MQSTKILSIYTIFVIFINFNTLRICKALYYRALQVHTGTKGANIRDRRCKYSGRKVQENVTKGARFFTKKSLLYAITLNTGNSSDFFK